MKGYTGIENAVVPDLTDELQAHIDDLNNPHQTTDANIITSDITTNNATTSKHGFLPKLSNVATEFLNGQGGFTTPASTANLWNILIPNITANQTIAVDSISFGNINVAAGVTVTVNAGITWTIVKDNRSANPTGSMILFASSVIPSGWLLCDGSAVSRTTYADLFHAIGITWGVGDGTTTFNLPDLIAAAPVGVGTSTGYTQNETIALGTKYNDRIQGHRHAGVVDPAFQVVVPNGAFYGVYGASATANTGSPVSDGTNGTPRTGNTTRGKVVGVNYIIKF